MQTAVILCIKKKKKERKGTIQVFTLAKTHHESVFKGSSLPTVHLQILPSDGINGKETVSYEKRARSSSKLCEATCSGSSRCTVKTLASVFQTVDRWKV